MARADYRLCDQCDGKTFYDANLSWEFEQGKLPHLPGLGDWAVICVTCAKTFECVVIQRGALKTTAVTGDGNAR